MIQGSTCHWELTQRISSWVPMKKYHSQMFRAEETTGHTRSKTHLHKGKIFPQVLFRCDCSSITRCILSFLVSSVWNTKVLWPLASLWLYKGHNASETSSIHHSNCYKNCPVSNCSFWFPSCLWYFQFLIWKNEGRIVLSNAWFRATHLKILACQVLTVWLGNGS